MNGKVDQRDEAQSNNTRVKLGERCGDCTKLLAVTSPDFAKLDSRNEDARVMRNSVRLVPEVQQIDLTIVRRGLQERHQDCIHNASQLCR